MSDNDLVRLVDDQLLCDPSVDGVENDEAMAGARAAPGVAHVDHRIRVDG